MFAVQVRGPPRQPFHQPSPKTEDMNDQDKLRYFASLLIAKADGKTIESHLMPGKWHECDLSHQTWHAAELFRIKPDPTPEYWSRPEHVPGPVCWIAAPSGSDMSDEGSLIIGINARGIQFVCGDNCIDLVTWEQIKREGLVYSTTLEKDSWQPCTVKEAL